jgi:16S rRNA C967 or C1407 C5-methylase (RsmB/RsmF family)
VSSGHRAQSREPHPAALLPDYALKSLERYRALLGEEWHAFLEALTRPLPVSLWRNPRRVEEAQFLDWFEAVEHDALLRAQTWNALGYTVWSRAQPGEPASKPGNRIGYAAGLYHVQEEVSMIPPFVLDPQPGERILDLCAAPGNKTALTAALMGGTGTLLANDKQEKRIRSGGPTWDRLGLANIAATVYDGTVFPGVEAGFDGILIDAPCSGEGTFRKARGSLKPAATGFSDYLQRTQHGLLRRAAALCRPGGRIVYSTCTYAPEENERRLHELLAESGETLTLEPVTLQGLRSDAGLTRWDGHELDSRLGRAARVWPHHNDTGGFFVALLRKRP